MSVNEQERVESSASNPLYSSLLAGIKGRSIGVCVVGLGYVGLPTLAMVCSSGYRTVGVDTKRDIVERVVRGEATIDEPGLEELLGELSANAKLSATWDLAIGMRKARIVIICVQTPITDKKEPNLTFLEEVLEVLAQHLREGMLVILASTVPPSTTRKLVVPLLEQRSGLKSGESFWVAHCPERISPGAALATFKEQTWLAGGADTASSAIAAEFLRSVGVKRVSEGEVGAVEVAKAAENTFRDVNIAIANELALICEEIGVDVYEAIRLANTHQRVNIHRPGAGVGGPCLTKDPYLLLSASRRNPTNPSLILDSRRLNDSMPQHVIDLVISNLHVLGMEISESVIGVLGVTFRGGTDDTRNSPSEQIIRGLHDTVACVLSFDPLSTETFGSVRVNGPGAVLSQSDCVVIAADHIQFEELIIPADASVKLIVDGRRILDPSRIPAGVHYVAVGDLTHSNSR